MFVRLSKKTLIVILSVLIFVIGAACFFHVSVRTAMNTENDTQPEREFIKWVDFNVSYEALRDAMDADISSYGTDNHYVWTDLLAYLAAENGNDFQIITKIT